MAQRYSTPMRLLTMLPALLLAALVFVAPRPAAAEDAPPMSYGVDVVTNYVFRGVDLFTAVPDKDGKKHAAFQFTPAAQPSVTFNGPGGMSLGLWGSFALTNRSETDANLQSLDEIDYTLSWGWDNSLGAFSAGLVTYTTVAYNSQSAINELFFSISPKFLESLGGTLTHYVGTDATGGGYTYTQIGIGGGEDLTWGLSAGESHKLQDVTAKVGYGFGDFSVAANVSYRPNPELVGSAAVPYNSEGKYTTTGGETADYPPAVFWLTFSYAP